VPGIVWIWLAAVVLFLILELATPAFFFICFSVGAIAGGVMAYIAPEAYYWQLAVFALATIALIPVARRFADRIGGKQSKPTNIDRLIGKTAVVIKPITTTDHGQVRLDGEKWNAVADVDIGANEKVTILEVTGTKLRVEKQST